MGVHDNIPVTVTLSNITNLTNNQLLKGFKNLNKPQHKHKELKQAYSLVLQQRRIRAIQQRSITLGR